MFKKLFGILFIFAAVLAVGWVSLKRADIPFSTLESAYANDASQFITLQNGLTVHVRDEGQIDGPTLVLVHGFSASLHTWDAWVRDLKSDHRVISLDLPGHGLTRAPDEYAIGMDQFVKTVDEVTDYLRAEQFTLVGSSMGGNTAWEFALANPDKLNALVLVAASGWPPEEGEEPSESLVFKLLGNKAARSIMKDLDMSMLIRGALRDSFVDQTFVTDEMVSRYASLSRAPGHRQAILDLTVNRGERRMATPDLMAGIDVPTLILHGDQDNLVPVSAARRFAESIPGAEIAIYPNVGHLPQEEIAAESLADLRSFLGIVHGQSTEAMDEADLTSGPQPTGPPQ